MLHNVPENLIVWGALGRLGAVMVPGEVLLPESSRMTLSDAIAKAGGLSARADASRIELVRGEEGGRS